MDKKEAYAVFFLLHNVLCSSHRH